MSIIFSIHQRVYYENTDAGGVMFYGEYCRFFERARTEYLRDKGYCVARLANHPENPYIFVVRKINIDYKKPIMLNDMIEITASIKECSKTSILFEQNIYKDASLTTSAEILCVCLGKNHKPRKIDLPLDLNLGPV